jgi:hypothetical protein
MALVLIKAVSATNPDPVKDARGCYKQWDIVTVMEDAKHNGDIVTNPITGPFYLVRVVGATVADLVPFLDPEFVVVNGERRDTRRRAWGFEPARIPNNILNTLNRDHYIEVPFSTVQTFLTRKATR